MILDYNEYTTAQYMYKQAVIHTKLSNRLYPIQYISQHDTARQYRTCIMDSDMASLLIRSLCIKHQNLITCTVCPDLVSSSFYAIPISPLLIYNFFIYLSPAIFILLAAAMIIIGAGKLIITLDHSYRHQTSKHYTAPVIPTRQLLYMTCNVNRKSTAGLYNDYKRSTRCMFCIVYCFTCKHSCLLILIIIIHYNNTLINNILI